MVLGVGHTSPGIYRMAYWATEPLGHLLSPSGGKPLPLMLFGDAEPFVLCAVALAAGLVLLAIVSRRRAQVVGARSANGGLGKPGP